MDDKLWDKYEVFLVNNNLTKRRIEKLNFLYGVVLRAFEGKDLTKIKRQDIEEYITKLNKNVFKKENGQVYTGNTKADIKKFIRQFWKWLKGNGEFYPPEVAWIKTGISKDEKRIPEDVLLYSDVIKLAHGMQKIEYRILVLLLFDSGFRIAEIMSVRKKDITFKEYDSSKKCFWIKCTVSKTEPREVPIPLFTEELQTFLRSSYMESKKDDELIFQMSYRAVAKCLSENAEKILKRKVHPHLFRHSSATYYAEQYQGDRLKLAQKYGWTLSSSQMETYVRMSANYLKQGVKQVYSNEVVKFKETLQKENEELKKELEKLRLKQDYEYFISFPEWENYGKNIKKEQLGLFKKYLILRKKKKISIYKFMDQYFADKFKEDYGDYADPTNLIDAYVEEE